MLKHIVMWTVNQPSDIAPFAAELRSCKDLVPGMREFEVGTRTDGYDANHDVVLVSTFDDAAALEAYSKHPHHQAVVAKLGTMRKTRAVLDFVID
jgi:quinol monooxygenase YgiN